MKWGGGCFAAIGIHHSSFCLHTSEAALPENVNCAVKSW
jgi:hypothetical protein